MVPVFFFFLYLLHDFSCLFWEMVSQAEKSNSPPCCPSPDRSGKIWTVNVLVFRTLTPEADEGWEMEGSRQAKSVLPCLGVVLWTVLTSFSPSPAIIEPGSLALPLMVCAQECSPKTFLFWESWIASLLCSFWVRILAVGQRPWQLGSWTGEMTWGGNASRCRFFSFLRWSRRVLSLAWLSVSVISVFGCHLEARWEM